MPVFSVLAIQRISFLIISWDVFITEGWQLHFTMKWVDHLLSEKSHSTPRLRWSNSIKLLSTQPLIYISQMQSIWCSVERCNYVILVLKSLWSSSEKTYTPMTLGGQMSVCSQPRERHMSVGRMEKRIKHVKRCNEQQRKGSDWTRRSGVERAGDEKSWS